MRIVRSLVGPLVAAAVLVWPGAAAAQDQTATTVTLPATPVLHGQTATLTATVANTSTPATDPVGTVRFLVDGTQVGTARPLTARTAQVQTLPLRAGTHTVQAVYDPGPGFVATPHVPVTLTVGRAPTTTLVRITPASAVAGQDLNAEIVVAPSVTPPLGAPSGGVAVAINGALVGTDTLDFDGIARGVASLAAPAATVRVDYQGDAAYAPSSGTTTVTVNKAGTVLALSASPNPVPVNQTVTVIASIDSLAPSNWLPTGTLTGAIDGQPVPGSVFVDGNGAGATITSSFPTPGVRRLTSHFAGDANFLDADAALDLTVTGTAAQVPTGPPARRVVLPRGLTLKASPSRDRRAPYRFTLSGALQLPGTMTAANGCSGRVTVEAKLKAKRVARKTATVSRSCRFSTTITVPRKGKLAVTAAFGGNDMLAGVSAKAVKVTAG